MTPRTFWTIFIKILGIWLVLDSLSLFSQFLSSFNTVEYEGQLIVINLLVIIFSIGIYALILRFCLVKTDWIIDKLNLDKGFKEEKFEINIHHSSMIGIATIVIGGLLFADSLPLLCKEIITHTQQKKIGQEGTMPWIIFFFVKTLIGYLLMTNYRIVTNLLEKQKKEL
jgi:hypothetical protein